jgi:NAD+ kinase
MKYSQIGLTIRQAQQLGSSRHPDIIKTIVSLVEYLTSQGLSILIDENIKALFKKERFELNYALWTPACAGVTTTNDIDLLIVIGGDGSFLDAAKIALQKKCPIVGINLGKLGFLADILPSQLEEKLGPILKGQHCKEERQLLSADIGDNKIQALNDMVISVGKDSARLMEFDIVVDGKFLCSQRSDGLIISTPTGSTAYALSAGGPIISTGLPSILLVPMFPHTLTLRPVVLTATAVIELRFPTLQGEGLFSADGQIKAKIQPKDVIKLTTFSERLIILHPEEYDYFKTLREKLGWGEDPLEKNHVKRT